MNKELSHLCEVLSSRHLALSLLKECKNNSEKALEVLGLLRDYFDSVERGQLFDDIEQAVHSGLRCTDEINAQSVKFNLFWRMAFEHEQSQHLDKPFDVFPCLSSIFFRNDKYQDFPDDLWYKVMFDIRTTSENVGELEYYYPVQTFWGNMLRAIYLPEQKNVLSRLDNWGLFDMKPTQMIWFCNHFMVTNNEPMQWYLNEGHNSIRYRFFKFLAAKGGLYPYSKYMNKMLQAIVDLEKSEQKNGFVPDEQISKKVNKLTK